MSARKHKVLITSDWGVGKTTLALAFSEHAEGDVLSLDYERGQDYYVVEEPRLASPEQGLFYVRRVVAPSVYEVRYLVEKIRHPQTPGTKLLVEGKPVQVDLLSDRVKAVSADIQAGRLKVSTILFDTVTRLCELSAARVFEQHIRRYGEEKVEKMSQLIWVRVKDSLSELFYDVIESDLHLIMTAWAKPKFDRQTRQSTDELVADVLKNVNAFVDLSLLLEPSAPGPSGEFVLPRARVLKSRLRRLPIGSVLPRATWPTILAQQPQPGSAVAHPLNGRPAVRPTESVA